MMKSLSIFWLVCLILEGCVITVVSSRSGPEFIEIPPETVSYTNNSGIHLNCVSKGDPRPILSWVGLDGNPVASVPGIREVWRNGTLFLFPFDGSHYRHDVHAGVYQCKASNEVGIIITPPTTVKAVVVQELSVRLHDEYVPTGNTAVLRCSIPLSMRDYVSVTAWERDSTFHLYPSVHGDGKYHVVPDGRLLVHQVGTSDSHATYRCRILHKLTGSTAVSNVARIIVSDARERFPPRMITKPTSVKIETGSATVIPCVAHGFPVPQYRWFLLSGRVKQPFPGVSRGTNEKIFNESYETTLTLSSSQKMSLPKGGSTLLCEAYNEGGVASFEIHVERSSTIHVGMTPKVLEVDSGATGHFRCGHDTQLSDRRSVTWHKDGELLSTGGRRSQSDGGLLLHITSVRRSDTGMYQCFVEFEEKTLQAVGQLKIGASPPEFVYRFIQQTLSPGPSVSLKCIAKASPTPSFSWLLDGFPLPHSDRFLVGQYVASNGDVVSHVNISHSKVTDGGEYSCKAENNVGFVTHSSPLYIYGPAHIRPMGSLTAVAGETFGVRCPVAGFPLPVVSWSKGGRPLPLNRRHKLSAAKLEIEDVSRDADEGEYTCIASDRHGRRASQRMSLSIVVPPSIKAFEFGRLVAGMRAQATCLVHTGDPPLEITWLRNGVMLKSGPDMTIQRMDDFTSILLLNNVVSSHTGNYSCVARNAVREGRYTAHLLVRVAPRWKSEPEDVDAIENNDVVLNCSAEGFPLPEVTWRKVREGSTNTVFHSITAEMRKGQTFGNGSLLIRNVRERDEGAYLCEISNGVGKGLSAIVNLGVHASPKVFGEKKIEARRGDAVSIRCRATGDPPLTLTFARDGHPVDSARVRYNSDTNRPENSLLGGSPANLDPSREAELQLHMVTPLDSGKYACTATNPYGTHTFQTNLLVQDAPAIPRDLKVTKTDSRTASVTWLKPKTESGITNYLLLLQRVSDDRNKDATKHSEVKEIKIVGNQNSYELMDLSPATSYKVRLLAENNVGKSPASDSILVRTEGESPSRAPVSVKAVPISSTAVKVEWRSPDKKHWHGALLGYHVGYRKKDSKEQLDYRIDGAPSSKDHSWTVNGLDKYSSYVFVVRAFNPHGQSVFSKGANAITLEDTPESPPENVECTSVTSSRLQVSWSPVPAGQSNGNIVSYTVSYVPLTEGYYKGETRVFSGLSGALADLNIFTNYSITVAASTRAGLGVTSPPIICSTDEEAPQAPAAIKAVVSGPSSIVVAWTEPQEKRGILTKYTLFSKAEGDTSPRRRIVPPLANWLQITGLHEDREMQFWLTASTRVGKSQSSPVVRRKPSNTVPAGIHSISKTILSPKSNDIQLSCSHSGEPEPKLSWSTNGIPISSQNYRFDSRMKQQNDGSLFIRDLKREDAANYTCFVNNIHGSDSVTYLLKIQMPPSAFRLLAIAEGSDSIKVSWKRGSTGGSPIDKLILTWRPASGEWRERIIPWHLQSFLLSSLQCGTEYHLYLTAYNSIGPSEASEIMTVKTIGGRPIAPPKSRLLFTNSSTAVLRLYPFHAKECPVKDFFIKLKSSSVQHWLTDSGRIPGHQREFTLPNLNQDMTYTLQITAINDAGETKGTYSFSTAVTSPNDPYEVYGEELMLPTWNAKTENLYSDPAFIIPVIISCVALIVIAGAISICFFKKPIRGGSLTKGSTSSTVDDDKSSRSPWKEPPLYGTVRKGPLPHITSDMKSMESSSDYTDEIHPYATFQLKPQDEMSSMASTLQSYGFQDPCRHSSLTAACRQERMPNKIGDPKHGRIRSLCHASDFDDYEESGYSESDSETVPSSKESVGRNIFSREYPPSGRSSHHNMLYITSDRSVISSPERSRKSLPRKSEQRQNVLIRRGLESQKNRTAGGEIQKHDEPKPLGHDNIRLNQQQMLRIIPKPSNGVKKSGSSDALELSETECDRVLNQRPKYALAF